MEDFGSNMRKFWREVKRTRKETQMKEAYAEHMNGRVLSEIGDVCER